MADTEETVEESSGPRSQLWKHEAMVDWINEHDDVDLDSLTAAEVIAYAFARRVAWRQSETYAELVEAHRVEAEEARQARAEERAAAKEAREAERAAAKAAKEEAEAAKSEGKPAAKATKSTKATKATKPAAAKATRKRPAAKAEDPFG